MEDWQKLIPSEIVRKYEVFNYNHAVEILAQAYPHEFLEIARTLDLFSFCIGDLTKSGGNESVIPKKFRALLNPLGWSEVSVTGDLHLLIRHRNPVSESKQEVPGFINGHNIDFVKGKIAIDLEWNSKDQTFDRDLFAFRTLYECGVIACGIIITRSESMDVVFTELGIKKKYGASTTWMGKLTTRLDSRRHGGCPLLVVGITPRSIIDWEK